MKVGQKHRKQVEILLSFIENNIDKAIYSEFVNKRWHYNRKLKLDKLCLTYNLERYIVDKGLISEVYCFIYLYIDKSYVRLEEEYIKRIENIFEKKHKRL